MNEEVNINLLLDRLYTTGKVDKKYIWALEHYITKLKQENERYKKIFEGKEKFSKIMPEGTDFIILSKTDYDRQQEDIELNAIELKSRIDKSIEYIEKYLHEHIIDDLPDEESKFEKENGIPIPNAKEELLNILQGKEN